MNMNKVLLNLDPIYRGIKKTSNIIGSTLGPNGKTVLYTNNTNTISTKDGYSVSRYITSDNPDTTAGINLVRQACKRQVEVCGDGTTSTAVLALAMIDNIPASQSKALLNVIHSVNGCIDKDKKVNKQYSGLYNAAMVSSNADTEISKCVAECVFKNGKDGHYIVEEREEEGIAHEQLDGYIFDSGYAHSAFVNTKYGCELRNPVFFIKEYVTLADIAKEATDAIKQDRAFVVIGQPDEQCLASLVSNHLNGNGSYCVIIPKQVGQKKRDILADITQISSSVTKIIVKKNQTIMLHNKNLKEYIETISNQETTAKAEKDYQKERLARLKSKVCKIYIGANSIAALRERKDRLEDAILSTISSMDGVIPGAGHYLNSLKTPFPCVFKAIYKRVGLKTIDESIIDSAEVVKQSLLNAYECYQIYINSKHSLHSFKQNNNG